ncbi:MAG TPA: YihA family ribosome biogenesis GTP-binding protein [Cytophagales bacterium]|nr:YihA family ribosome biogenesis GTP-binding protein [Cytophagales bacterium]HAP62171.1 YihA family ribosome biogenesis GTP-binding protein [Cytophagales bacterium]
MEGPVIKTATFVKSSSKLSECPPTAKRLEVAFIGRSNVGKSSLINMLVNQKKLAKTSGKPGKTQLINHFLVNESWYLVDLPGYGYAKVSKTLREKFGAMIHDYLKGRENLACIFVLIDVRIPPQKIDVEFINWVGEQGLPQVLIFTKADKMTGNKVQQSMAAMRRELKRTWEEVPMMMVSSSETKLGRAEILNFIDSLQPE